MYLPNLKQKVAEEKLELLTFNPVHDGGRERFEKRSYTNFSPVTSTNVRLNSQYCSSFSLNPFAVLSR